MSEHSIAARVALTYLDAVGRARRAEDGASWDEVERWLAPDFEIRMAGHGDADLWLGTRSREEWLERLRALPWNALQTETVSLFGDDRRAVAEQTSTWVRDGVEHRKPVCFVFEVDDARVKRITVYRNDFVGPAT